MDSHKVGTWKQAEALAKRWVGDYQKKPVDLPRWCKWMPPAVFLRLPTFLKKLAIVDFTAPFPEIIIAAGRQGILVALALRKNVKNVVLMNPGVNPCYFDAVIAPIHDQLTGPNVISTQGAIHGITMENLRFPNQLEKFPRPRIGVLLGGNSIHGKYTDDLAVRMANDLKSFIKLNKNFTNATLLITPSRRTSPAWLAIFEQHLGESCFWIWDQTSANPYPDFLKEVEAVIVCEDSISMASEACVTGKPVIIYPTGISKPKFKRFYSQLTDQGYVQKFQADMILKTPPALKELDRVIDQLRQIFEKID